MSADLEITNDLEKRKSRNRQRQELTEQYRQEVLKLDVDWKDFQLRFENMVVIERCKGPDSPYRFAYVWSLLDDFELDKEQIGLVLHYFDLLGAHCDCTIYRWIDLSGPAPIGAGCVDCHEDYDECYMVHDEVWRQTGLGGDDGQLCIGCLENRLKRQLNPTDFIDAPINEMRELSRSLRLESRLGRKLH